MYSFAPPIHREEAATHRLFVCKEKASGENTKARLLFQEVILLNYRKEESF